MEGAARERLRFLLRGMSSTISGVRGVATSPVDSEVLHELCNTRCLDCEEDGSERLSWLISFWLSHQRSKLGGKNAVFLMWWWRLVTLQCSAEVQVCRVRPLQAQPAVGEAEDLSKQWQAQQ